MRVLRAAALLACLSVTATAPVASVPGTKPLTIAVAQIHVGSRLDANLAKMLSWIGRARREGSRVVVFPEGALRATAPDSVADLEAAKAAIRRQAARDHIYVLFGGVAPALAGGGGKNFAEVIDPEGRLLLHYDKLYDQRDGLNPPVFRIDGIPAHAIICADRWLRAVEELPVVMGGAQISFELSNNFDVEWVDALEWYWYVPRAVRNNVWVVFANAANPADGAAGALSERQRKHGHTAVLAPDGRLAAAAEDGNERLVAVTIDPGAASRHEALARSVHPALRPFWEAGLKLWEGGELPATAPFPRYQSPEVVVKVAAGQIAVSREIDENLAAIEQSARAAAAAGADVVAFPELSVTGAVPADIQRALPVVLDRALARLKEIARKNRIAVIAGMPHLEGDRRLNAAFVIGPDGALQTRYDQMAARQEDLFAAGSNPKSMWFRLKGAPAIVTIGRDGLWSEIAELAALAGAQLHFHIAYEAGGRPAAQLRRLQMGASIASFRTLTAVVNAAAPLKVQHPSAEAGGGSTLWDDLQGVAETRSYLKERSPPPAPSPVAVYSFFSANAVVSAGTDENIVYASRRLNRSNPLDPARFNHRMASWYELGARLISAGEGF